MKSTRLFLIYVFPGVKLETTLIKYFEMKSMQIGVNMHDVKLNVSKATNLFVSDFAVQNQETSQFLVMHDHMLDC